MQEKFKKTPENIVFIAIFILGLAPWIFMQPDIRMSNDAAWLFTAAERVLAGLSMKEAFYDNNPPLSYMIYIPAVLIARLGFATWNALTIYAGALAGLSLCLTGALLFRWPGEKQSEKWICFTAYAASITILCFSEFAQKDTFIAATLPPFLLAQYFITQGYPINKWLPRAAILLGTPFILLKPHFGLLPVALLLHRAIRRKNLSVIRDFDFLCLAVGTLVYALVIFLRFPDFLTEIFQSSYDLYIKYPYTIEHYITHSNTGITQKALSFLFLAACLVMINWGSPSKTRIALFFSLMAALSVLPFWVQNKGFSLHLIPTFALILPAFFTTLYAWAPEFPRARAAKTGLFMTAIFACFYFPLATGAGPRSHEFYMNSSLAKLMEKRSGESFFMETYGTGIIYPVEVYMNVNIASRFPSLWFVPGIYNLPDADEKKKFYISRFGEYLAEDLERYKPPMVLAHPAEAQFSMLEIFGAEPHFKKQWERYEKKGTFALDFGEYDSKITTPPFVYDIYERIY